MRIAVNTRLLIENKLDGIGWFTYETLSRITVKHPEHEFYFFFDRPFNPQFVFNSNVHPMVAYPPARHPLLWYLWFEYAVPHLLKDVNADLFLSPDGYLSLSASTPSLAVIHDLNFYHRPQDLPFSSRKYYNYFFPKFAKHATRLATVSEYSRKDIANTYHVPESKIDVVYDGANEKFRPLSESEKQSTRKKFSSDSDYFIFIGTLHPRKNVARLLLAFDEFRKKSEKPMKLLIVGEKFFLTKEIEKTYANMHFREDVTFTGRLSVKDLYMALGAAQALIFVPLFEGFGIPVLESMYCDVPVVASKTTSVPEVGGNAAHYVDPESIDSIADGMMAIVNDQKLVSTLLENAKVQRKKFSWDLTAEKLWESIEKCF